MAAIWGAQVESYEANQEARHLRERELTVESYLFLYVCDHANKKYIRWAILSWALYNYR